MSENNTPSKVLPPIGGEDLVGAKLTQYSHGAGCGCKIAPKVLDEILKSNFVSPIIINCW
jgi:hypothetical protein